MKIIENYKFSYTVKITLSRTHGAVRLQTKNGCEKLC